MYRLLVILLLASGWAAAHPGRTNSEGCHAGSQPYHCHNGGGQSQSTDSPYQYDRREYGSWADQDGDCLSTRHEMLESMNTGQVAYSTNGCRVIGGRWLDPFSGQLYYRANQVDIDHVVPVAWAHSRGGYAWSSGQKRAFYNDPANLLVVSSRLNRSKGAQDPGEWLPPNLAFRCEYVLRFTRVALKYQLLNSNERGRLARVQQRVCN